MGPYQDSVQTRLTISESNALVDSEAADAHDVSVRPSNLSQAACAVEKVCHDI